MGEGSHDSSAPMGLYHYEGDHVSHDFVVGYSPAPLPRLLGRQGGRKRKGRPRATAKKG